MFICDSVIRGMIHPNPFISFLNFVVKNELMARILHQHVIVPLKSHWEKLRQNVNRHVQCWFSLQI
jgi:hypothetical protein